MKTLTRRFGIAVIAGAATIAVAGLAMSGVLAQQSKIGGPPMMNHSMPDHAQTPGMMEHGSDPMASKHNHQTATAGPTLPGQDAFGAIQEIAQMLEADPKTDWSRVNLEALRQHLIDMNEVTLKAEAAAKPIDGGIEVAVTGSGRTLEAIQRMVPAHAHEIERVHLNGWSAKTDPLPSGVLLTVTAGDPKEVQHIRGLGFIGIMVNGHHHQPHHLAMAQGEMAH